MRVERIDSYKRFAETKKEWNALLSQSRQCIPFLTHQWFDAWWQSFGQNDVLEILFFRDESNSLLGIAPLMIKNNVLQFIASHEVTDYCDFFSREDKCDEFYQNLCDYLHTDLSRFSFAELINIPAHSLTLSILPRLAADHRLICEKKESESVPMLELPESYQEYILNLSRKNRHELRRKIRKLDSLGDVHIERITELEKLEPAIEKFIALHRTSSPSKQEFWQKRGMSGFFHQLVFQFARENWPELLLLYVKGRTIAALLSFSSDDTVYFYNVAYEKEFSSYSPGFFLFDRAINQAIADGKAVVDFLRGREKYKYFFGAKESKIYSLKLEKKQDKT